MIKKLELLELNGLSDEGGRALPDIKGPHVNPIVRLPPMNDVEPLEGS